MSKRLALHLLMSEYQTDSRVRNETESLVKNGVVCQVYCLAGKGMPTHEIRNGVEIRRFGLLGSKLTRFFTGYVAIFLSVLFKKIDVVHAHDFNVLPLGYVLSKIKRVPCIYDSHELWSESDHQTDSKLIISLAKKTEVFLAKRVDFIITVSDSIRQYMLGYFKHSQITVVRNVPSYVHVGDYDFFRQGYGISKETPIFLYQGLMADSRGVGIIVEALGYLDLTKPWAFVFMGFGPVFDALKLKMPKAFEGRVILIDKVHQDDLLKYTMSADIGVHAILNTCLNHDYCLPNKVFEYIHAGLALLCSNLKELSAFIEDTKTGATFKEGNAKDLADKMIVMIANRGLVETYKERSRILLQSLTWDNESIKLMSVYSSAFKVG